jgi:hypothetical protein
MTWAISCELGQHNLKKWEKRCYLESSCDDCLRSHDRCENGDDQGGVKGAWRCGVEERI